MRNRNYVVLIGLICFLADFIYEGFRSIMYVLIYTLGGSIVQACTIWGIGDIATIAGRVVGSITSIMRTLPLVEYSLGYMLTGMLILPLLLPSIGILTISYIVERFGKGIRGPPRDIIVSSITSDLGKSFGIIEALDQVGAILGPLTILVVIVYFKSMFSLILTIFSILFVVLTILTISVVRDIRIKLIGRNNIDNDRNYNENSSRKTTLSVRSIIYSIGTVLLSASLFPIISIQYISLQYSHVVYYGILMFLISSIISAISAIPLGRISENTRSIIVTSSIPVASVVSLYYYNSPIIDGILYGFALSVIEVWIRGYAKNVYDSKIYSLLSTCTTIGMFIAAILFPQILSLGCLACAMYSVSMFIISILLINASILKL